MGEIDVVRFQMQNWKGLWFVAPVLFAAFGYHNVIPSLYTHYKESGKVMRYAIFFGTLIPFIIYVIWQVIIIGILPQEAIVEGMNKGQAITEVMQSHIGKESIRNFSKLFSLFAIITSMLGVSFSMVDFLGDGLSLKRRGLDRFILCLLTFVPPFIITSIDPSIFIVAIGVAGGFGEAFLNGILPAWLVWVGRYKKKLRSAYRLPGGKLTLAILMLVAFIVMVLEGFVLYYR
jgi:tyrosine-specific transport protein